MSAPENNTNAQKGTKMTYRFEKQQASGWQRAAHVVVGEKQLASLKLKLYVDDDGQPFCESLGTIEEFAAEIGITPAKWNEICDDTAAVNCPVRVTCEDKLADPE